MDKRVFLSKQEAIDCLPEDCSTQIQNGPVFIGADCSKEDAIGLINKAWSIEIGGDMCRNTGRGIVLFELTGPDRGRYRFVSHDESKLKMMENKHIEADTCLDNLPKDDSPTTDQVMGK